MQALQDFLELGIDFNNAHVQPQGEYHFHGLAPASAYSYVDPEPDTEYRWFSLSDQDIVHTGMSFLVPYSIHDMLVVAIPE